MKTFEFYLRTPEKNIYAKDVVEIQVVALDGQMSVLADHQPMVTSLEISFLKLIYSDGKSKSFAINGGVMQIKTDSVIISTIEADEIKDKAGDNSVLPQIIKAKNDDVRKSIEVAIEAGGYYNPDLVTLSLLSEERAAKAEILKEIASQKL